MLMWACSPAVRSVRVCNNWAQWQVDEITQDGFDWVVHLEYLVLSSMVKTLGLAAYRLCLAMVAFLALLP